MVKNVCNVLPVPEELDLQVAAQLPCGALRAFTTVRSARDVALPAQRRKNGIATFFYTNSATCVFPLTFELGPIYHKVLVLFGLETRWGIEM